jgi:hypothetical protein
MTARGDRGCDGRRCVMKNATRGRLSEGNLAGDDRRCQSRGRGRVWMVTDAVSGRVRNGSRLRRSEADVWVCEALGPAWQHPEVIAVLGRCKENGP